MKAIVFDKSGTIVDTTRVVLDLKNGKVIAGVSSTRIVDEMEKGALIILERSGKDYIFSSDDKEDFATFYRKHNLVARCIYANTEDVFSLEEAICTCKNIKMSMFKKTIDTLFDKVGVVRTNNGVIYDLCNRQPAYVLTAGGRIVPGVKKIFDKARERGWDIYVATGDTLEGMREIASCLDIPCCRIFCFQTEGKKAESIKKLKESYEKVVMVGNDSNDMAAFKEADKSVLVLQDGLEKNPDLFRESDYVIADITEIEKIL
ncbi:MAG: HAD family hydrolase [Candidatus Methanofastidiosia archaeon]